ncbi:hypothetical protein F5B22DRAFT_650970 [Xylaria bambusicola]|uniref:uncharacterized protein n=1 Tax=Xylaria bambusicola TaxID=326684 RepID=UPI00200782D2|nr:uncharacterized protein F5B22DRAFT_650970 [Xylaria bambusicola]KAI0506147.1 hypothetical protein F5B22DRAFT_650970 [Xylaria bambusicola]
MGYYIDTCCYARASDALPHAIEDMVARLNELRHCVQSLEKKVAIPALTEEVRLDEEAYLDLEAFYSLWDTRFGHEGSQGATEYSIDSTSLNHQGRTTPTHTQKDRYNSP